MAVDPDEVCNIFWLELITKFVWFVSESFWLFYNVCRRPMLIEAQTKIIFLCPPSNGTRYAYGLTSRYQLNRVTEMLNNIY